MFPPIHARSTILCSHCTTISLAAFSTSPVIPQTPGAIHSSVSTYLSILLPYLSFHQLLPHQLVSCLHLHSSCVHFIVHSSSPCKSDAILFPPFPDFFLLTQHLSTFAVLTIPSIAFNLYPKTLLVVQEVFLQGFTKFYSLLILTIPHHVTCHPFCL